MACESALRHNSSIRPYTTIRIDLVTTVGFVVIITLLAIKTRIYLSTHANPRTRVNEGNLRAYAQSFSNNLMSTAKWPVLGSPSAAQSMDVRATDATC
jgi:hypothetical protein